MNGFFRSIGECRGVKGALFTFLLGILAALSMPPINAWPLLFVSVPLFLLRLRSAQLRQAMVDGWLFGFGYFCFALHWIAYAFFVDAGTYLWMMPFAVGGLAAVMAGYWGVAGWAAAVLERWRFPIFFGFPVTLAVAEWLRGRLMTGFPWAVPGLATDGMGGVAQTASIIGMTGLSLVVLLWAASPATLFSKSNRREKNLAAAFLATLPVLFFWGQSRLEFYPTVNVDSVDIRIVQPNLSQDENWRLANASKSFEDMIAESTAPSDGYNTKIIIWPEAAVAFLVDESEGAKDAIQKALKNDQFLLTGALRRSKPEISADYFTSIIAFDHTAKVVGVYDKWRLVPGGEFLPFSSILRPLGFDRLVSLPSGFTAGKGPGSIDLAELGKFGALICYEAAFPHDIVPEGERPKALVNVTNDGWFGNSIGPYQHLAQVRMRAIEQGLPVIRSANTGISAVFDAYGRLQAMLPYGVAGHLDAHFPAVSAETLYSRYGDLALLALIFAVVVAVSTICGAWKLS